MSVTWAFRDTRWQRRDMTDTSQSYDLAWTITDFTNVGADLGVNTGMETLNSAGENVTFGFTGYVDSGGGNNQIVPTVFPAGQSQPSASLVYSGSENGQLTGKYDGSNFNLTLNTEQTRSVNGTSFLETMNGDGDTNIGENLRAQLRAIINADYTYSLGYTTYTFVDATVPEPSVGLLASCCAIFLVLRRR